MIRGALVLAIVLRAGVALASGHTCHEVSPVVGYRRCGHFGSRWAHSRLLDLAFEPGLELDRIVLSPSDMANGTAFDGTSTTGYHLRLHTNHALGFGLHMRVGYHGPWLTVGVEYAFGILAGAPTIVTALDTGQMQTSTGGNFIDFAGVVGLHHRWNRITLGAELAIGSRLVYMQAPFPAGVSACATATGGACASGELDDEHVTIEAAARLEWWVDRQITLTVTAGYDLATGSEMLTVGFGAHGAPYDGD